MSGRTFSVRWGAPPAGHSPGACGTRSLRPRPGRLTRHAALAHEIEAAMEVEVPPRAIYLRSLMAELERLANHFGDIGAICNDASFSLMHAQCGILREKTLRTADLCFGHRLMMDAVVPGGIACDLASGCVTEVAVLLKEARRRFPELVELHHIPPSLPLR